MQSLLRKVLLVALIAMGLDFGAFAAVAPTKGVIRVKLQPEVAAKLGAQPRKAVNGVLQTGTSPLDNAVKLVGAVRIEPMLPPSPKYAAQRAKYGLDRWYTVSFDGNVSPEQARKVFAAAAGVERSEIVTPMSLQEGRGTFRLLKRNAAPRAAASAMPWNDPQMSLQWHYQNFGDIPYSVAGADINLFDAWKVSTGSPDVVVAIIDGGIDTSHEDLSQNLYVNLAELNGEAGKDDDGNGYVDDIYGYNFCTNEGKIYPHNHGTHVAGTVAAVNNNGIGVAGVAGGDGSVQTGVRLMSCQVFDPRSGAGQGDFAKALVYACENGASIAQCSWGWDSPDYYEQAVLDAIDYFTEQARGPRMTGGLCIFAMGNTGETGDFYPASYEPCVAVTAMTSELTPAPYSSNGPKADIVAPGGLLDYGELQGVLSTLPRNQYGYSEGTSMATPHVSGVAALVLSKFGSPTFTSETLRTQLLSSVKDFYGHGSNSAVAGNFGSGYLDAAKAMTMNQDAAPEAVADFTLTAAQDYIHVQWEVPAGGDSHIIYYSKSPFTAQDDLTALSSKVVDTKFLNPGETASAELDRLDPLTKYYIAIRAVNRWGQASPLSAVKEATTNAGPKLTVDKTSLSMKATADVPVATATLAIGNDAEGLLKWKASKNTRKVVMQSVARPAPGNVQAYKGKIATADARRRAASVKPEYNAEDYPAEIYDYETLWSMIGDTDKSLPNSLAQWFRVDPEKYPQGFNLTALWFQGLESSSATTPVIEIYKGDMAISSASLIQKVDLSLFIYNYSISLQEQLYFAPGESFWVVAHFPGGQEGYVLPMARTAGTDKSNTAYMSNDNGASWNRLSEALKGSIYEAQAEQFVWGVKARSLNPDFSGFLELNPEEGTVMPGQKQEVALSADGSKLVNGTYNFNLRLTSNESGSPVTTIPVSLSVSGNKPDVVVPKVVDFGSLLVGQSKTLTVEVYNRGFGSVRGSTWNAGLFSGNIASSSEHFAGPKSISAGFPARTRSTVDLTFAPKAEGSHTGTITFTDSNGNSYRILVQGAATMPAQLAVEPAVVDAGTIAVGDEPRELSFKVTNTGKYPLEYVFPTFSDETVEGAASLHKFGYTVASTLEGYDAFEYSAPVQVIGAKDLASTFTDDNYVSGAISLPFSFPYYGKSYDKLYITSFGGVMFALNQEVMREPLTPDSYGLPGTGLICAWGRQLQMGPDSHVEYGTADGKFVVNFRNVLGLVYASDYAPVSFRIVLSPNGDIEMFYDDYEAMNFFQGGSTLFCGINDPAVSDVVTVTSSDMADYWGTDEPTADNSRYSLFTSGTAVRFTAPQTRFVSALAPAYGLVTPGESVEIKATVAINDAMVAGPTVNNLAIVTNDPQPAVRAVRFEAIVSAEGLAPAVDIASTDIDFGSVFRTSELVVPVTVRNTGRNDLNITGATFAGTSGMTVGTELPAVLKPGLALDLLVTVPTETEGALADKLTVATDAGDTEVSIHGTVIGTPVVELSLNALDETVLSGTPLAKTLEVSNTGNEDLTYTVTGDELVNAAVPEKADAAVSYSYRQAVDGKCAFDWIDITADPEAEQHAFRYYNEHDWIAVDLPFQFPFYGKKYSRIYIYNTGFVSFTERHDDRLWPEPPAAFPNETVYTNLIAPYWGLHSMNTTKTAGTYHKVSEHQAVISFLEYGNSLNAGVDFQLILNDDGSFKFQYKAHDEYAQLLGAFGLAGISDENGEQYVRLPDRSIAFGNAVAFTPIRQNTLKPGEKDEVSLTFDTDRLAGSYTGAVKVSTNAPHAESIEIPAALTVTGEAKPVIPSEVSETHVMGYSSTDYSDPLVQMGARYSAYFNVANEGTAPITITNVSYESPTIMDEWLGEPVPAFYLFANLEGVDWITGEPTGKKEWQQVGNGSFSPVTVGKEPLEFAVPMMEGEYWMTPGEYTITVTITYVEGAADAGNGEGGGDSGIGGWDPLAEGEDGTHTAVVTVRLIVTPAPQMVLDKEEIAVTNADDDLVTTETVVIGNNGQYDLEYSLEIDPTGVGDQGAGDIGGGGIDPMSKVRAAKGAAPDVLAEGNFGAKLKKAIAKAGEQTYHVFEAPADFDFNRALFYSVMPGNSTSYNYGANSLLDVYKASVAFKAPADGFNISHIYTPINIESASNVTVRFDIVSGSDPETGEVIGSTDLFIPSQKNPSVGSFYLVPFDRAVYMNPGEEFCVVATFPEGIKFPAYLCVKEEPVTDGRYLGWTQSSGWFDLGRLFENNYGSLGYVLSCLETKAGEPWIKLLNPETEGKVAPEASAEVKVQLNAAATRLERGNKAMLIIRSNDPTIPVVNVPVTLDRNSAPVVDAPASKLYAREGEPTRVEIPVSDLDGDDVTVTLTDEKGIATLEGAGEQGSVVIPEGTGSVAVVLSPDFGHNGEHSFVLEAVDAKNHSTAVRVSYQVEKVNRAPQPVPAAKVVINEGEMSELITFSTYFDEPDGEEMTYTISVADLTVAEPYQSASAVVLRGVKAGNTTLTVTAADPAGLTASVGISVEVTEHSGIDDVTADSAADKVVLLENPATDAIRLLSSYSASDVTVTVFDMTGATVLSAETDLHAGEKLTIPFTAPRGAYLLSISAPGREPQALRLLHD